MSYLWLYKISMLCFRRHHDKQTTKVCMLRRCLSQAVLAGQSNAGTMFGQTVTEFSRPKWSGGGLSQSSAGVNKLIIPTNSLHNIQVQ